MTLYLPWYQLIPHKARVFFFFCLAYFDIHKSIYLGYNAIAIHLFQYNFPKKSAIFRILPSYRP